MKPSADLEISLHHHDAESYLVEFRFSQPDSEADIRLGQGEPALVFPHSGRSAQRAADKWYLPHVTRGDCYE